MGRKYSLCRFHAGSLVGVTARCTDRERVGLCAMMKTEP
jgi:hypothetical protein